MHRFVALLLVLGVLGAPGSTPTASADGPPPTNGPVLYLPAHSQAETLGYEPYAHLLSTDGTDLQSPRKATPLDTDADTNAKFSPDGASIATTACLDPCEEDSGWELVITRASAGTPRHVGRFPGYPLALAWSPDGTAVAALVGILQSFDGAPPLYEIYRTPVATGVVTRVLGTTQSDSTGLLELEGSGLSWGPTDEIAFIAGSGGRTYRYADLYTVPADGGAPALYNTSVPDDAGYCSGALEETLFNPSWSPDGSSIAVRSTTRDGRVRCDGQSNDVCSSDQLLDVTRGAARPTVLVDLSSGYPGCGGVPSAYPWEPGPVWSLDGDRVLFGHGPGGPSDGVDMRIVDVPTSTVTSPVTMADTVAAGDPQHGALTYGMDWQPCPTGTCVRWDASAPGADLGIAVSGYADPGRVGAAEPVHVTVTNHGSERASGVSFEVSTPRRTTTQGWVRLGGARAGWTCDYHDTARLRCSGARLGAGATLRVELGVIGTRTTDHARLTATVTSTSSDPDHSDNHVVVAQAIRRIAVPEPPTFGRQGRERRSTGWHRPASGKRWAVLAADIVSEEPTGTGATALPGWYGATLWAYAPSGTVHRIDLRNGVCAVRARRCGFVPHTFSGGERHRTNGRVYSSFVTGSRYVERGPTFQRARWTFHPGRTVAGSVVSTGRARTFGLLLPR